MHLLQKLLPLLLVLSAVLPLYDVNISLYYRALSKSIQHRLITASLSNKSVLEMVTYHLSTLLLFVRVLQLSVHDPAVQGENTE